MYGTFKRSIEDIRNALLHHNESYNSLIYVTNLIFELGRISQLVENSKVPSDEKNLLEGLILDTKSVSIRILELA